MEFAKALRNWRKRMELSRAEAAAKLAVSPRTLAGWEHGRSTTMEGTLLLLMRMIERDHNHPARRPARKRAA